MKTIGKICTVTGVSAFSGCIVSIMYGMIFYPANINVPLFISICVCMLSIIGLTISELFKK